MVQEIKKVIAREVYAKAMDLGAVWRREFGMSDTPNMERRTENTESFQYTEDNGYWQLMIRRSFSGYWVELFRDHKTIRSVEVK